MLDSLRSISTNLLHLETAMGVVEDASPVEALWNVGGSFSPIGIILTGGRCLLQRPLPYFAHVDFVLTTRGVATSRDSIT